MQSRITLRATLWRAAWFVATPILLTLLIMRYLLPSSVESRGNPLYWIAQAELTNPVIFAVGLCLVVSLLLRYWRHCLPGFRVTLSMQAVSSHPLRVDELRILEKAAILLVQLARPRATQRRKNTLSANQNNDIDHTIRELSDAVAQGLAERAEAVARDLRAYDRGTVRLQYLKDWLLVAIVIVAPVVLAFGLRAQVFQSCKISGNSMLPTLETGDIVAVQPSAYRPLLNVTSGQTLGMTPRRGDVIIFDNPTRDGEDYLVKRVVGLPGDYISMKGGLPVINGWTLPVCDAGIYANVMSNFEPIQGHIVVEFLEARAYLTLYKAAKITAQFESVYQVKDHEVFVLGDNRNGSSDSRSWNEGNGTGVPISNIRGRVDRFLVGTTRNGTTDFARLFKQFNLQPHLEGIDSSGLSRRVDDCLRKKPAQTRPPPPESKPMIAQLATQ